jgi:hypothetical protein
MVRGDCVCVKLAVGAFRMRPKSPPHSPLLPPPPPLLNRPAGHKPLKAAIQWLAASAAGRHLRYYCFGDAALAAQLELAQQALLPAAPPGEGGAGGGRAAPGAGGVTVGQLYAALRAYAWREDGNTLLADIAAAAALGAPPAHQPASL